MISRTKLIGTGTAVLAAGALGLMPGAATATAAAQAPTAVSAAVPAATTLPVTGTLADGSAFSGQVSNLTASVVDGVPTITGTITGTGLPATGTTFSAPIEGLQVGGSCTILDLDLGPLNLDVLGLVIDLSDVHLDITAVPGAGNLLGNLLCAIAGLLDQGAPLTSIVDLLNDLLTGLGL
jgi:hypothetical protein